MCDTTNLQPQNNNEKEQNFKIRTKILETTYTYWDSFLLLCNHVWKVRKLLQVCEQYKGTIKYTRIFVLLEYKWIAYNLLVYNFLKNMLYVLFYSKISINGYIFIGKTRFLLKHNSDFETSVLKNGRKVISGKNSKKP